MNEAMAEQIIAELRDGTLAEYRVEKDVFPQFRKVLIAQDDFKSFRGNAQRGGAVIYTYEPGWTA